MLFVSWIEITFYYQVVGILYKENVNFLFLIFIVYHLHLRYIYCFIDDLRIMLKYLDFLSIF